MHNIRHVLTVLKKKNSGRLRKELRVQKEEVQRLCCEVRALREAMRKERNKKSRMEGIGRIQRALKRDREIWDRKKRMKHRNDEDDDEEDNDEGGEDDDTKPPTFV